MANPFKAVGRGIKRAFGGGGGDKSRTFSNAGGSASGEMRSERAEFAPKLSSSPTSAGVSASPAAAKMRRPEVDNAPKHSRSTSAPPATFISTREDYRMDMKDPAVRANLGGHAKVSPSAAGSARASSRWGSRRKTSKSRSVGASMNISRR